MLKFFTDFNHIKILVGENMQQGQLGINKKLQILFKKILPLLFEMEGFFLIIIN